MKTCDGFVALNRVALQLAGLRTTVLLLVVMLSLPKHKLTSLIVLADVMG